jgi:hypothetical protein
MKNESTRLEDDRCIICVEVWALGHVAALDPRSRTRVRRDAHEVWR